jgi:nucleoporin NUP2
VNGTPEPQTKEDGDAEAPQEQISLTEGGPGEEDEVILHEVRAKATKYVPVDKSAEDSPAASSSPWQTQGVGPLRVLKNKTTGKVRILLRAEPRGHVAMNKMLIAGIKYEAIGKQVKIAAAKDDGNGLETWLLQVKKPEAATELAGIMEANKEANK